MLTIYYRVTILHLKIILHKVTHNAKVKNCGVELRDYDIKFKGIKGIKKTLADTLLRLIGHGFGEPSPPEKDGHYYGYSIFELLPDINVTSIDAMSSDPIKDTDHFNCEL